MMNPYRKHKGMLSVEMVIAISVLAIIISVLAALSVSFGRLNSYLWAKHTCLNAGQAQMDAIIATGKQIDEGKFNELWPGVTCTLKTSAGTGQWQDFQRLDLTLSKEAKQKTVEVQFTRYLPVDKGGVQ